MDLVLDHWLYSYKQYRITHGYYTTSGPLLNELKEQFEQHNLVRDFRDYYELQQAMAKDPKTMPTSK